MSVLYRAVWSDSTPSDQLAEVDHCRSCVAGWIQETDDPELLTDGESEFDVSQGRHRKVLARSIGAEAFEVTATDQIPGESTEWATTVRVVAEGKSVHTLVELTMSSDDLALRVAVGRPKVVHELLEASGKPVLDGCTLPTEALALPANGISILTGLLADPARTLPVIVCAEPSGARDEAWLRAAHRIAVRTEGVAVVITLDANAVAAFKRELRQLAIWDGGVRVYVPGVVTANSEGWRHRYYLRKRLEESEKSTIDRIVYFVAQLSTRRRVPDTFRVFGARIGLPEDALDGMIPAEELAKARDQWEYELELARDEQSSLERELASANGHLARLRDALTDAGLSSLLWGTKYPETNSVPDEVQDASEAVLAAQAYLSDWLALPDQAIRALEDIDTAPEAYNWGNKIWRGLRALASYGAERASGWDNGGFWEWCASGPLLGWPATDKKLSMTESESVRNNRKFLETRVFEIDRAVDPSGKITMLAHLKIAEGGGDLAPRVYFYDDTRGSTKMVHVGFVGPHYLVPNKSAN